MAALRGVPLAQQANLLNDQGPGGDRYVQADISGYRTGRLAHEEGEPPGVQITQKNLEEVMAWENQLIARAKEWHLTKWAPYLSQVSSGVGVDVETLLMIPVELLEPIHPYMGDLSTEQARNIERHNLMDKISKHAEVLKKEKSTLRGRTLEEIPQDIFNMESNDSNDDFDVMVNSASEDEGDDPAQYGLGRATARIGGAPVQPTAFPTAVGTSTTQSRYAHPLTDLSTALDNPLIRTRMELFYKLSNQKSVMSIISNPLFHGDVHKVVKSEKLIGWEEDALGRLTNQIGTHGRFDNAKPEHFYPDNGARRAFGQLVVAVARQDASINNNGTQKASMAADRMLAEAIIICMACVWDGPRQTHLVKDMNLYRQLTKGGGVTYPTAGRRDFEIGASYRTAGKKRMRSILY